MTDPLDYDPRFDHCFSIYKWPTTSRLTLAGQRTVEVARPEQEWLDEARLKEVTAELRKEHSGTPYFLVNYSLPYGESRETEVLTLEVARCDYAEAHATAQCLWEDPEAVARIRDVFDRGDLQTFARSAPPGVTWMTMSVLSPAQKFLAVQRSAAVATGKGLWAVGVNETMTVQAGAESLSILVPGRSLTRSA